MSVDSIYTKKTLRLDNRVWRTLLSAMVLALVLMSYRVTRDERLNRFSFTVKPLNLNDSGVIYNGDPISFTAAIKDENIIWDFGDNTSGVGQNVLHQYLKKGRFLVTASGEGSVAAPVEITIQNPPPPRQTVIIYKDKILGSTTFYTKTTQTYSYEGPSDSCTWTIQGQPSFGTKYGKQVSFNFPEGSYTIHVVLDGNLLKWDDLDVVCTPPPSGPRPLRPGPQVPVIIAVPDASVTNPDTVAKTPPANETDPPPVIGLPKEALLKDLVKVQKQQMNLGDFKKYGIVETTPVLANGKEQQNFGWLLNEIVKTKTKGFSFFKKTLRVQLKSVFIKRFNNDITLIEVIYEYK